MKKKLFFLCICLFSQLLEAQTIELLGSNGVRVGFAGVLKATPTGLVLLMKEGDQPITVSWDRFDSNDLRQNHTEIHQAMTASINKREEVELRLGVYKGKKTPDEMMAQLSQSLNESMTIELPPMSAFFDDKDIEDGRFRFNHLDDFKFAEKRSNRYLKSYTELLVKLLSWNDPTFSKSTHTLIDSDGTRNIVITEARPSRSSISVKPMVFLDFLSLENNNLKNDTVTLLRYNRNMLEEIIAAFAATESQLNDGNVLAESSEISNLLYWAKTSKESFEAMRDSMTTSASLDRDLRRILQTFKL